MMKRILKIFRKNISLGVAISSVSVVGAVVYSIGYLNAMKKFNNIISYTQEKQQMYSKLSEIDYNIRDSYIGNLSDKDIYDNICKGYINGIGDRDCIFLSSADYKAYSNTLDNLTCDVESKVDSNNVGILRCGCMSKNFSSDFISKLNDLMLGGVDKIVVDLRNSNTGLESEVFKALEYLAPSGDIVKSIDKDGVETVVCSSSTQGVKVKLAVIVNEATHGISEVFASALKDSCGAKIIGTDTAGYAVRRKVATLSDNSVVLFPDAFYVSNSGKKIFKVGLEPDIKVENEDDNDKQLETAIMCLNDE